MSSDELKKPEAWTKTKFTNVWHALECEGVYYYRIQLAKPGQDIWQRTVCGREFNLSVRDVTSKPAEGEAICFTCSLRKKG